MKYTTLLLFIFYSFSFLSAQNDIILKNPSFEGKPRHSILPPNWKDAGTPGQSLPDLHGYGYTVFNVFTKVQDGNTFVGLVVRDNDSWEAITQELNTKLRKNISYEFTIYLARSKNYISLSRRTQKEENFNTPVILRIWGGNSSGNQGQLLAASTPVEHTEWLAYTFTFIPEQDWEYLTLQAYFAKETVYGYNGNLLIDNCSVIKAFHNIGLAEVDDFSELEERDLYQLVLQCKIKDNNHMDMEAMDIIYDSWYFEQVCTERSLRELISTIDDELLQHYILVYKKLGLEETILLLTKTAELENNENKKNKDKRFLKTVDNTFFSQLKKEMLFEKQLEYISLHRTEIIEALAACKE